MIYIGLTGWGDHDSLYPPGLAAKDKLPEYAAHFPTVEVDSYFYAIQPRANVEKWIRETPPSFQFIVKAYQGMTGHERGRFHMRIRKRCLLHFWSRLRRFKRRENWRWCCFSFRRGSIAGASMSPICAGSRRGWERCLSL